MKFMKLGLFISLLVLSLALDLCGFNTAVRAATQALSPANRECTNCHTADLQIHKTKKSSKKCNQCHTFAESSVKTQLKSQSSLQHILLKSVSQIISPAVADGSTAGQLSPKQLSPEQLFPEQLFPGQGRKTVSQHDFEKQNVGMRFPMYYATSRLGDKPHKMVLIPAGEFTMGTNDRLPDEGPQHKVLLSAFYIDKFEVTNLQYKKFIDETNRRSPKYFRNRTFPEGRADHPVTYVGWDDAAEYCQWADKRLLTEQEWEKAARGTDARMYPWGNDFEVSHANTPGRWKEFAFFGDTTPVGAFKKGVSPYGVHDMSGNVWEWTASWYKPYPGNTTAAESYGERYKVLKGGSWFDCSFYKCGLSAPVYNRSFFAKKVKNDTFGFRCAKNVELKRSKK